MAEGDRAAEMDCISDTWQSKQNIRMLARVDVNMECQDLELLQTIPFRDPF